MVSDLLDPLFHSEVVGRIIVRPFCSSGEVPARWPGTVIVYSGLLYLDFSVMTLGLLDP